MSLIFGTVLLPGRGCVVSSRHEPPRRKSRTLASLEHSAKMVLLAFGSALPFIIAVVLIASTNDENPLDRLPGYDTTLQETLILPLDTAAAVTTEYQYRDDVRVIIEGSATTAAGARRDAFYIFADASGDGDPLAVPLLQEALFTIDGQPARPALDLADDQPAYARDHVYTGVYEAGGGWTRITFGAVASAASVEGELRITVVQIE